MEVYRVEVEALKEENVRLRALLREVLDDTPMYRINRYTEAKIRAVLEPKK